MSYIKKNFLNLLSEQGKNAGLPIAKNLANEKERLREINRLHLIDRDLTDDRRINNVTELACYLTEKPQCSVNLLTDKTQLSKNTHGFSISEKLMLKEIPRDISMCQYVLELPKDQLIIENVREHKKTKNFHRMFMAPNIQFYAGTPIITSNGYTIGTLCITDKKPGKLTHSQRQGLRLLSDQISNIFETGLNKFPFTETEKDFRNSTKMRSAYYSSATILFTDFVGFTNLTESMQPGELIETLDEFFKSFDQVVAMHSLKKVKTIGDSYMAVGGVPDGRRGHAFDVCKAGLDIIQIVLALNMKRKVLGQLPWNIRIGIHTGPLIAGFLETGFDIWGDAVNIASRLESTSTINKIQISQSTREFVEEKVHLTNRGFVEFKNKGNMETFFLDSIK